MTALAAFRRRTAIRLAGLRWEQVAGVLLGLAVLLAVGLTLAASMRGRADATPSVSAMPLAPAAAAMLIEATSGEQSLQVQATGAAAEQINAALPFSSAPVQSAAPFAAPTGGTAYDRALTCLTQAVYYEAGYEPLSGRRAVAQVILNRMRHPAYPKSVCGVVYQRNSTPICQFTFVCDGSMTRAPTAGPWKQAREIAAAALNGYVESSVGQATHYHANYVAPRWAPMLAKITQIGAHIFYRWPGAWGQRGAFTGRYIGEPVDPSALRVTRAVTLASGDVAPTGPVAPAELTFEQDPTIRRAANDVGGLMDPSKGWTLSIPDPRDTGGRTRALIAQQGERVPAPPAEAAAVAAVTTAGSGTAVLASSQD